MAQGAVRAFLYGIAVLAVAPGVPAAAADGGPAAVELTALVDEFLAGVSRNDATVHDRFWADDLVYTRAAGQRIGKADILRDARSARTPAEGDATTRYSAEDFRVQQYGDTAVVAFRLVGTKGAASPESYLNTGTFVKRAGRWQAVAWQATRVPAEAAAPPKGGGGAMGEVAGSGRLKPPMTAALTAVVVVVMVEHVWFLVLEMFLWTRPLGLKTFRNTPEFARQSAALAANQGLYNGFLAAGLLWGLLHPAPDVAPQIQAFFLACVAVAGTFGAITVSRRIFFIQALPALAGLALLAALR